MSWLDRILPPKIKKTFTKKKVDIPKGLWTNCNHCRQVIYKDDLIKNLNVCVNCSFHNYISARDRIKYIFDEGSKITEIDGSLTPKDILNFKDTISYVDRIENAQKKTKEKEAIIVCIGEIGGILAVVASFEFKFIGGSMGAVVGEKFARAVKIAAEKNLPFICFASSGGARMQEGTTSLMQMAKTTAALHLLKEKLLPFISILINPTMGGVSASFAFVGDIVIAEPHALIGFAGPRVIEQTVREKLPDNFQSSEFLLEKGAIDLIVDRRDLKEKLIKLLNYFKKNKI